MCEIFMTKVKNSYKCFAHTHIHRPQVTFHQPRLHNPRCWETVIRKMWRTDPNPPHLPAHLKGRPGRAPGQTASRATTKPSFPRGSGASTAPGHRAQCIESCAVLKWAQEALNGSHDPVPGNTESGGRGCWPVSSDLDSRSDSATHQLGDLGQIT